MPSVVDICNLALARLGDEANIASIDPPDDSVQANYCSTFYPLALTFALDKHNWRFATRRFTLPSRANEASDVWQYCYGVPSDLVNLISISAPPVFAKDIQYSMEIASDNSQVLYCNVSPVQLVYVSSTVSAALFPPAFVEFLSTVLASYLAGPMIKGDVGVKTAGQLLQLAMSYKEVAIERDCLNVQQAVNHIPAATAARN
jgi:hypothetical protein